MRPRRKGSRTKVGGVACFASALLMLATAATAHAGALDRAKQTGKLRLGYVTDARPFSYQDSSGQPAGYSIEICKRVVEKAGAEIGRSVEVEYVPLASEERRDAFMEGDLDLLCSGATVTLGRRALVSFSHPIYLGGIGVLVRKDAAPRLRALLAGERPEFRPRWRASYGQILRQRKFVVHSGTAAKDWLEGEIDRFEIIATLDTVDDYDAGVESVIDRRADVFFGNRAILVDAAIRSEEYDRLVVLPRLFTYELYAMAMQRDDEDLRLLVDTTLSELSHSGEMAKIHTTHLGEPDEAALMLFRMNALPD